MTESKNRRESKTLQGSIVVIIGFIVNQLSMAINIGDITNVISAIFVILGVVMTIVGRKVATERIK